MSVCQVWWPCSRRPAPSPSLAVTSSTPSSSSPSIRRRSAPREVTSLSGASSSPGSSSLTSHLSSRVKLESQKFNLLNCFFVLGAFILDTILNFNNTESSQDFPSSWSDQLAGDALKETTREGFRGNFMSLISREQPESELVKIVEKHWNALKQDR